MWFFDKRTKEEKQEDREFQKLMNWKKKNASSKEQYRMAVEQEKSGKEILATQRKERRQRMREFDKVAQNNKPDKPLSEHQKKQISIKINQLSEERDKFTKRRQSVLEKSPSDELYSKMRQLKSSFEHEDFNVKHKREEAKNATSRKEKRMLNTVANEWQKTASKIKRELDQVTQKYEHQNRLLEKALKPLNTRIEKLSSEIATLEKKLTNDYRILEKKPLEPSNRAPKSDIERQVFNLRREIDQLTDKMRRYSHIDNELKSLKKEYDFRTRYIEGERERAKERRMDNAYKWYAKKTMPLHKQQDREKELRGLDSNSYSDLRELEKRLSELQPQYDAHLQEQKQTRQNQANQRKQAQLTQEALKKINSILKDDNF